MLKLVLQGLSPSTRQGQRQHFGNAERSTQHLCSCLRHAAGGIALLTYPFSFPQLRAAAAPEAPFQLSNRRVSAHNEQLPARKASLL